MNSKTARRLKNELIVSQIAKAEAAEERLVPYETHNFTLLQNLSICLKGFSHSVVVGKAKDIEHGKRFIDKAEKHPHNMRDMYQHAGQNADGTVYFPKTSL